RKIGFTPIIEMAQNQQPLMAVGILEENAARRLHADRYQMRLTEQPQAGQQNKRGQAEDSHDPAPALAAGTIMSRISFTRIGSERCPCRANRANSRTRAGISIGRASGAAETINAARCCFAT